MRELAEIYRRLKAEKETTGKINNLSVLQLNPTGSIDFDEVSFLRIEFENFVIQFHHTQTREVDRPNVPMPFNSTIFIEPIVYEKPDVDVSLSISEADSTVDLIRDLYMKGINSDNYHMEPLRVVKRK